MANPWMLVAHHEESVRDFARDALKAKFNELNPNRPIRVARVSNLKHAQDEVDESGARSCELIVLGAATPANRNVSVGSSTREPTMEFIQNLKTPNRQLPIIVSSRRIPTRSCVVSCAHTSGRPGSISRSAPTGAPTSPGRRSA